MAIRNDGLLFAWGSNYAGQIGDGSTTPRSSPVQIGALSWLSIAGGASHSIGIRSDNLLFSWGSNDYGQLGTGNTTGYSSPVQVGSDKWIKAGAGNIHSFVIKQS